MGKSKSRSWRSSGSKTTSGNRSIGVGAGIIVEVRIGVVVGTGVRVGVRGGVRVGVRVGLRPQAKGRVDSYVCT